MIRARFHANEDDPRPVSWPIPLPYWVSGYGHGYAVVIAYAYDINYIKTYWPEATHIESEERDTITYTDRFPKPDWYEESET